MQAEIDKLNRIRLRENLSYRELGDQCGVPEPSMRRILQGRSDPYDRTLYKLREFLERRRRSRRARRSRTRRPQPQPAAPLAVDADDLGR